jgi:hypothetical protein
MSDGMDEAIEGLAEILSALGVDADQADIREAIEARLMQEPPEEFRSLMDACEANPLLQHSLMTAYPTPQTILN